MILNLSITLPDEVSVGEVAAYLLEQAESAAGQLEHGIIPIPAVDETTYIHIDDDREALLFRSE